VEHQNSSEKEFRISRIEAE